MTDALTPEELAHAEQELAAVIKGGEVLNIAGEPFQNIRFINKAAISLATILHETYPRLLARERERVEHEECKACLGSGHATETWTKKDGHSATVCDECNGTGKRKQEPSVGMSDGAFEAICKHAKECNHVAVDTLIEEAERLRALETRIETQGASDELAALRELEQARLDSLMDVIWDLHDDYAPRSCERIASGFHTDCNCGFQKKLDALRAKEAK